MPTIDLAKSLNAQSKIMKRRKRQNEYDTGLRRAQSFTKSRTSNRDRSSHISRGTSTLPVLSSSGHFAFEVESDQTPCLMHGPVKLPILRLPRLPGMSEPAPSSKKLESILRHKTTFASTATPAVLSKSGPEVILDLLRNMTKQELDFLQYYLFIDPEEYRTIAQQLSGSSDSNGVSYFALLLQEVRIGRRSETATLFQTTLQSSVSPSMPHVAPGIRLEESAFSLSFSKHSKPKPRPLISTKRSTSVITTYSSSGRSTSDPTALRRELISSISRMQLHTEHVKSGLRSVQQLVSLSHPRARAFMSSMAADQLYSTLAKLVHRQLSVGFGAWKLDVYAKIIAEKRAALVRFMFCRRLMSVFDKIVSVRLRAKFGIWVDFLVREKYRIELDTKRLAAIAIQRIARGMLSRLRVKQIREGNRFTRIYNSLVKLQSLFRGKVQRWKFQKYCRDKLELASALLIQRNVRGYFGRKRARYVRLRQYKGQAATMIQALARGHLGRQRAKRYQLLRLKNRLVVRIQALGRGYIGRQRVAKILQDKANYAAARAIQALARGYIARKNLHHRRAQLEDYRAEREAAAKKIQAAYRGFRGRVMYRMYLKDHKEWLEHQRVCITRIQTLARQYLAKRTLKELREEQMNLWIKQAMEWQEVWAEDSNAWFYVENETGNAVWEPNPTGYTKADGQLVLANGKIVDPPDLRLQRKLTMGDTVCVECVERTAIRGCNECGDNFCTICYKSTHAIGSRRNHTYHVLGPKDCNECELLLAERWCVACDEAYCDACWRKVHAKGKRRFHPFSAVYSDGSVDARLVTIDGEQVDHYDASFLQQKVEAGASSNLYDANNLTVDGTK